ncbi:MAG TPA: NAD(P)H-dependent oxidoreductase [Chitinophagaceae bacterium]|nr:NAD(P)H-dependent oxidoreductase [Chitinophagaceae bacterium]
MNISIVSGSPRKNSVTFRVALFLKNILEEKTNHTVDIIDVRDHNIPQMLQDVITSVEKAPADLKVLTEKMFASDAFILVTPEFNGSYTPALKNLFDHFPKQVHKTFGIVTASPGVMGGMRATQQLQLLINALFGIASPYMLVTPLVDKKFDENGNLLDASFQAVTDTFIHEFLWLAESVRPELKPAYN